MKGLASCPWCPWEHSIRAPTREDVIALANAAIARHNEEAGHRVKPGRKPRTGYRRGEPVS